MGDADRKRVANGAEDAAMSPHSVPDVDMAPNRNNFEKNLWRLNNATESLQTQMKKYWNNERRKEIDQCRDSIFNLQNSFRNDSVEEQRLADSLKESQTKHTTKQREIRDLEDVDMTYKNLAQAQQKLTLAEDRYKKQNFASVREEKLQVSEIDRIKRNIAKLNRYIPLVEERKVLEAAAKELRQEIRTIRSRMRAYRDQMNDCRNRIRELKTPYLKLKKRMFELNEEKRDMIKNYELDRQNYALWLQQNNARGVSTFPVAMAQEDQFDNFEPFCKQKKTCVKLLRYLKNLKRNCEPVSESHTINSDLSAESSADEFPESFKLLKLENIDNAQPSDSSTKKRGYVKKYVKKTLPIIHSIDYIKLFADIDIDFPTTYAELDSSISKVDDALKFYNDQTNLERLEEAERANSPFSSMISHNGSDLDSSFLMSPRSDSSLSNLVVTDESSPHDSRSFNEVNFPQLRNMNSTRN